MSNVVSNNGNVGSAGVHGVGQRRGNRLLRTALVVSLSLNMLVAGFLVAMTWKYFRAEPRGLLMLHHMQQQQGTARQGMDDGSQSRAPGVSIRLARPGLMMQALRRFMHGLSDERRATLQMVLLRHRPEMLQVVDEVAALRAELLVLLREEEINRAALTTLMHRLGGAEARMRERMLRMVEDVIASMTAEERRKMAAIMEELSRRRGKPWRS